MSDSDIVASGGLSHYTLSIDASIVVDKPETQRLSLFLPFLSEIQLLHVFSPKSLLILANAAPNCPSY